MQEASCSQQELDTVLNLEAREWEAQQEENRFWLSTLIAAYASRYYRLVRLLNPPVLCPFHLHFH